MMLVLKVSLQCLCDAGAQGLTPVSMWCWCSRSLSSAPVMLVLKVSH